MDKSLRCCNCGKKIARKIEIAQGHVEIDCPKCGTVNIIGAARKDRVEYETKEGGIRGECGGPELKLPEGLEYFNTTESDELGRPIITSGYRDKVVRDFTRVDTARDRFGDRIK